MCYTVTVSGRRLSEKSTKEEKKMNAVIVAVILIVCIAAENFIFDRAQKRVARENAVLVRLAYYGGRQRLPGSF